MRRTADNIARYFSLARSFLYPGCAYLIFFITAECNSRCKTCFYWREIENAGEKKNVLSGDEIERIAKNFGHLAYLSLTGGEPVLRDDLDGIAKSFYKYSGTRFVNFTTNGLMPEKTHDKVLSILRGCPGISLKVNLSIDDIGDKNDEIRGVKGAFAKTLETFSKLKKLKENNTDLHLFITTVLSSYNKDSMLEIVRYVENEIKPDGHSIALLRGNPRDKGADGELKEAYERLTSCMARGRSGKRNPMQKLLELMMEVNLKTLKSGRTAFPCVAGGKMLTLTEKGLVLPCEAIAGMFPQKDFIMGDIRKEGYDIKKVMMSQKAKDVRRFIKSAKCKCTFECAALWSIIFNPKMHPKIFYKLIT